jgi:transcriptional regulator of heat shock response
MGAQNQADTLNTMRKQLAWLLSQVEEYESGRAEIGIENGIFAAHKCAEIASQYRQRADNLAIIIAATEGLDS